MTVQIQLSASLRDHVKVRSQENLNEFARWWIALEAEGHTGKEIRDIMTKAMGCGSTTYQDFLRVCRDKQLITVSPVIIREKARTKATAEKKALAAVEKQAVDPSAFVGGINVAAENIETFEQSLEDHSLYFGSTIKTRTPELEEARTEAKTFTSGVKIENPVPDGVGVFTTPAPENAPNTAAKAVAVQQTADTYHPVKEFEVAPPVKKPTFISRLINWIFG